MGFEECGRALKTGNSALLHLRRPARPAKPPQTPPRLAGNAKLAQIFVRVGGYVDTLMPRSPGEPLDTGKLQLFTDLAKELVAFIDRGRAAAAR
jgi:hypothetical protein